MHWYKCVTLQKLSLQNLLSESYFYSEMSTTCALLWMCFNKCIARYHLLGETFIVPHSSQWNICRCVIMQSVWKVWQLLIWHGDDEDHLIFATSPRVCMIFVFKKLLTKATLEMTIDIRWKSFDLCGIFTTAPHVWYLSCIKKLLTGRTGNVKVEIRHILRFIRFQLNTWLIWWATNTAMINFREEWCWGCIHASSY